MDAAVFLLEKEASDGKRWRKMWLKEVENWQREFERAGELAARLDKIGEITKEEIDVPPDSES